MILDISVISLNENRWSKGKVHIFFQVYANDPICMVYGNAPAGSNKNRLGLGR